MKGVLLRIATVLILTLISTKVAQAHQPIVEEIVNQIEDPTIASQAIYGVLDSSGEIDEYTFSVTRTTRIPVELLIPYRNSNLNFRPQIDIVSNDILIVSEEFIRNDNQRFYEPFSQEMYWQGPKIYLDVKAGEDYKLLIYQKDGDVGTYTLGVGEVEDFSNVNFIGLLKNVFYVKTQHTNSLVTTTELLGTFFVLAGLIIGLGAVTVIDVHGFLARKSTYWTEVTIKAHKVTKPLIWLGISIHAFGLYTIYQQTLLSGVALFQFIVLIILILNGIFLSFYISPKLLKIEKEKKNKLLPDSLQRKIFISFVISIVFWWSEVFLTVWHLLYLR